MLVPGQKAPPGCLILARGTFGSASSADSRGMITHEVLDSIGATSQPSLYIEIKVKFIKVEGRKDAYVFRPVFLQFNDTAASNPGDGEKNVGVMLSLARKPLSTLQTAEDVRKVSDYFVPFNFGTIKRGTYLISDDTKAMPDTNEQPIKQQDVFFELVRIVPAEEGGARLIASLNSYALVTESADPTLFDGGVNRIVSDKAFSNAATTLVDSLFPQSIRP